MHAPGRGRGGPSGLGFDPQTADDPATDALADLEPGQGSRERTAANPQPLRSGCLAAGPHQARELQSIRTAKHHAYRRRGDSERN